jgi:hypothetical protein
MTYPTPGPDQTASGAPLPITDDPTPYTLAQTMGSPRPPRRRRMWLLIAVLAVIGVGLVGAGGYALARGTGTTAATSATASPAPKVSIPDLSRPISAGDPNGRAACALSKQWLTTNTTPEMAKLVAGIHDSALRSTNADIVYRGNAVFDAWNKARVEQQVNGLKDAEVLLRVIAPLIEFDTACLQAGYRRPNG